MTEEEIQALVDDQLTQEPSGYDHNINQPKCHYCGGDFHGLAITDRMERMRLFSGEVDPGYRYSEDHSPILCPGSFFIGPPPPPKGDSIPPPPPPPRQWYELPVSLFERGLFMVTFHHHLGRVSVLVTGPEGEYPEILLTPDGVDRSLMYRAVDPESPQRMTRFAVCTRETPRSSLCWRPIERDW